MNMYATAIANCSVQVPNIVRYVAMLYTKKWFRQVEQKHAKCFTDKTVKVYSTNQKEL